MFIVMTNCLINIIYRNKYDLILPRNKKITFGTFYKFILSIAQMLFYSNIQFLFKYNCHCVSFCNFYILIYCVFSLLFLLTSPSEIVVINEQEP